jgi:hypothetical protein
MYMYAISALGPRGKFSSRTLTESHEHALRFVHPTLETTAWEEYENSLHVCDISSSHGGEYDVQSCHLGYKSVLN